MFAFLGKIFGFNAAQLQHQCTWAVFIKNNIHHYLFIFKARLLQLCDFWNENIWESVLSSARRSPWKSIFSSIWQLCEITAELDEEDGQRNQILKSPHCYILWGISRCLAANQSEGCGERAEERTELQDGDAGTRSLSPHLFLFSLLLVCIS